MARLLDWAGMSTPEQPPLSHFDRVPQSAFNDVYRGMADGRSFEEVDYPRGHGGASELRQSALRVWDDAMSWMVEKHGDADPALLVRTSFAYGVVLGWNAAIADRDAEAEAE